VNTLFAGAVAIAIVLFVAYIVSSIKILAEYERGVVFRLGRVVAKPEGPGLAIVLVPFHRMVRISLRVEALEVVYFRVVEPVKAVVEVANFLYATTQLAQTTLRSVLGQVELDELLSQRDNINVRLQEVLDHHTGPWGVKVTLVEVKQVDLPEQMIRAIARQAEAERERRAKVIHAEGEFMAAEKLSMAAQQIQKEPVAIQLRYLQTLVEIGADKNSTIVFPVPVDLLTPLARLVDHMPKPEEKG
jgi:regulator of protease activity HflC (stomatin/prohibitin superfamily)